ncbi:MAG: methyltransferase, TIGR04325 family [Variovorax sp.]|nr:MAG: methyltransferase, TIGR04325 family [Variovorax sp.]
MHPALKKFATSVLPKPILRSLLQRRFLATRSWSNQHWGVFDSFAAARQWAVEHGEKPHFELDQLGWLKSRLVLKTHDYPMLFWLARALDGRPARVFDLGGSVGVSFLAYRQALPFAADLQWQVCELPETVALGVGVAREYQAPQLSFTSDVQMGSGADVLFTAGTIQYIETPLPQTLAALAEPPRHVLINRLPLTRQRGFVTLQHSGTAMSPNAIANDREFVQGMVGAGYRLVDRWRCLENATHIPLHPELVVPWFHGFYFVRDGYDAGHVTQAPHPDR